MFVAAGKRIYSLTTTHEPLTAFNKLDGLARLWHDFMLRIAGRSSLLFVPRPFKAPWGVRTIRHDGKQSSSQSYIPHLIHPQSPLKLINMRRRPSTILFSLGQILRIRVHALFALIDVQNGARAVTVKHDGNLFDRQVLGLGKGEVDEDKEGGEDGDVDGVAGMYCQLC